MLRLSVVGIKTPSMRYPITARASISKLSCKIPKSVTNASNVIVAPSYNNRAFIRLSSNQTSKPNTTSQNKQQIKENDEKKLTPEEEAMLDEENDDELEEQVEKYLEPTQFDEYTKPYNPTQDGFSLKAKENPFLDEEEEDMFEEEESAVQAKDQTNEELDHEEKEYDDDEVPPELKEVIESLDRDWPGWEEVFPKDGKPNLQFQAMIDNLLDVFTGKQQTTTFTDTQKINEEYTRLAEVMDTMDNKYNEWKQRRKEFLQIVKKYRQTTYFGIPTARVRFGRASGLKPSALNPDLAVSLRQDEQPDVISSPPPFHGGGCKHISLNRPAQYNPLNLETVEHLADLFKKWNENDVVYSVCLKGNGPAFIGGLDLKEMANSDDHVKRQYTFHLHSLMRTLSGIRKFYVPIANGVVGGPGVPIFMYGSAPYVTENAVMTVTDPATGLYPLGSFEALNNTFPKWFSKFLLMTGYPVTAGHWSMMKGKYIPNSRVPDLERRVSEVLSSKPERFFQALNEVEEPTFMTPDRIDDGGAFLSSKLELIGKAFNHTSVAKILEYLDAQNDTFASDLAKRMRQRSPIALLLIQLRYNIEAKREQSHQRRMEEIQAEVEAAKLAAEQVTPENVKAFLATLPEEVFGRGLVAMYDTACKATSQMKPLLNTIVPGRELTEEGVAKLKEGIDTRMKGVAFSVQDYIQAVWDKHSRPFLLSPDGATVYPWDPEYPKILYCMKPAEEREKLIQQWQDNQAEIVEKLKNPKNRDPNEATFQETEAIPGVGGIILPEGGAFNWFAEEAARQHNELIMQSVPEYNWEYLCQKIYYHKPGEPIDQEALMAKGGYMPGVEAGEPKSEEELEQTRKEEITADEKIAAEWERYTKELVKIRQMEARAFYRLAKSPEFSVAVKSLLQKNPASPWKPLEQYDFKTVLSYFMPGPDTAELDTAIAALDDEAMPDFMEWRRAKKYRPYWNHAFTVDMDAEEAL